MKPIINLIYFFSIAIIAIWLFRPVLFWLIGLDFIGNAEYSYKEICFVASPIAVILTGLKEFTKPREDWNLMSTFGIRIGLVVMILIVLFITLWTDMCGWYNVETHFNKNKSKALIVTQEFGCGATDSDSNPEKRVVKYTPIGNSVVWIRSVDTNELDKTKWKKIESTTR